MVDLHLHLDGSLTAEDILRLAECAGVSLPCQTADTLRPLLEVTPDCRDLGEYLEKFHLPLQVLQTEETLALAVYLLIKRLKNDGLCYAEIRFAPQLHQDCGLTQHQVVAAAVAGLQKGIAEFAFPAQLILCCMRGSDNVAANTETVRIAKEFLGSGVCAVDLAGNEFAYPTEAFAETFQLAARLEVPYIIHAGEAAGAESVQQALLLGARRIGHGIRSAENPAVVTALAEKKIPLELCFTSNLQTKAVANRQAFPLCHFLAEGVPVTVNTDNMTVSGTNLRREYTLLQETFSLSADTLKNIAFTAASNAFIAEDLAKKLKAQITQRFSQWLTAQ